MSHQPACDETLARTLPLPLAQLYRRAWNERNLPERNLAAYYLWEAALKLLASAVVVEYAERADPDPAAATLLRHLARPAVGHWWAFVRQLLPPLAEAGDAGFEAARTLLLGKPLADWPLAAELDNTLAEELTGQPSASPKVRLASLFDRLVEYRNRFIGHAGMPARAFVERLERVLLPGVGEVLSRLDVLAGRRLVFVDEVRLSEEGAWVVEWYELAGETARRLESLRWPEDAGAPPLPRRIYLEAPAGSGGPASSGPVLRSLHPLVLFADGGREEVFFLNGQSDRKRTEYLCYTTNRVQQRDELGRERRPLLAQALLPVAGPAPAPDEPAPGPPPGAPAPSPEPATPPRDERLRLVVLYKRNARPDEHLVRLLEKDLAARGHEVFSDRHIAVGEAWAHRLERQVREADGVIPLLSAAAVQSEMLAWEVQTADDEARRRGRPWLLPVRVAYEGPLPPELGGILDRLQYILWAGPRDDVRLLAELDAALRAPRPQPLKGPPPTGVLPLDTDFYVVRPTDGGLQAALARQDSIIKIKGARQVGKTSLLARGLKQARDAGARVVVTDFQKLNASEFASIETFYAALAEWLADQLRLDVPTDGLLAGRGGPSVRFERFVCRSILDRIPQPLVWAMDEVDRLFTCRYGSEVFGLVRSWHNARETEPELPWRRLTLAIAYATEAHLFISDMNQSPFNVGTALTLADFAPEQVGDLNRRYGEPLRDAAELARYHGLVGGHPFLVNRGLHELAARGLTLAAFEAEAVRDEGLFGDHLRRLVVLLAKNPELSDAVRAVLHGQPCPDEAGFFRLRSAGVVLGDTARTARLRCGLYARYLEQHL